MLRECNMSAYRHRFQKLLDDGRLGKSYFGNFNFRIADHPEAGQSGQYNGVISTSGMRLEVCSENVLHLSTEVWPRSSTVCTLLFCLLVERLTVSESGQDFQSVSQEKERSGGGR